MIAWYAGGNWVFIVLPLLLKALVFLLRDLADAEVDSRSLSLLAPIGMVNVFCWCFIVKLSDTKGGKVMLTMVAMVVGRI
jgi:hypothetical protein